MATRAKGDIGTTAPPYYLLALLTIGLALSFADRHLMAVLIQPIKAELKLSDTVIGLLTGLAFSSFYALCGIPLARLSDRGWRRPVIVLSATVWSIFTALCGVVQTSWQMALARFGVGAGEAGLMPAAQSLVADTFPPARLAGALSVLASASSVGILAAFVFGTQLEAAIGWRYTFIVMLVPGLVVSVLLYFTPMPPQQARKDVPALLPVAKFLFSHPPLKHLPFAQGAMAILMFAQPQWLPAYIERSFGVSRTELGLVLGFGLSTSAILGTLAGGFLSDRLAIADPRRTTQVAFWGAAGSIVPSLFVYLTADVWVAYAGAAISTFLASAAAGPIFAALQKSAPEQSRATATALLMLVAALIGLGLGPVLIGGLSDLLAPRAGIESLRYALLSVVIFAALWAMFHLRRVGLSA